MDLFITYQPPCIYHRFTELYMAELEDPPDLKILVAEYLKGLSLTPAQVDGIVKFYLTIKREASKKLVDGTGHKPCYRLETLKLATIHNNLNYTLSDHIINVIVNFNLLSRAHFFWV